MTVEVYLWFEIVKLILVIALLLVAVIWSTYGALAEKERRKAFKGLQKGFHVEFKNVESEDVIKKVSEKISSQLKGFDY